MLANWNHHATLMTMSLISTESAATLGKTWPRQSSQQYTPESALAAQAQCKSVVACDAKQQLILKMVTLNGTRWYPLVIKHSY